MNALALRPALSMPSVVAALLARQRALTLYGAWLLAFTGAALLMQALDPRLLASGVNVWIKPAKFLFSIAIFALTTAWFFGYVRPERRGSPLMKIVVGLILVAGTFELAYIIWQAAQGLESHFNTRTPFHAIMYALMGLAAVLLVAATLPLAWELTRRPHPGLRRDFVAAVVIGLILTFVLGGGLGGYMSSQTGHAVGAQGGHVPLFGWNRSGGDLRTAHFLGIHAQQAIPVLGALLAGFAARTRWPLLAAGSLAYVGVTLAIFAQAVAGRPLL